MPYFLGDRVRITLDQAAKMRAAGMRGDSIVTARAGGTVTEILSNPGLDCGPGLRVVFDDGTVFFRESVEFSDTLEPMS